MLYTRLTYVCIMFRIFKQYTSYGEVIE